MKNLFFIGLLVLFINPLKVAAIPNDELVSSFVHDLVKFGEENIKDIVHSNVKIPEIREKTPINHFSELPSHKENVRVAIAYFDDKNDLDRIAFIWEVKTNKGKISDINVIYDGSNPFMEENEIIKKYSNKHEGKKILAASNFPFDITHIDGEIKGDVLSLQYKNVDSNQIVTIEVGPTRNISVKVPNKVIEEFYLKNGVKAACIKGDQEQYTLTFTHQDFQYAINIDGMVAHPNELIYIANSMLY